MTLRNISICKMCGEKSPHLIDFLCLHCSADWIICNTHGKWQRKAYPFGCPICLAEKMEKMDQGYVKNLKGGI